MRKNILFKTMLLLAMIMVANSNAQAQGFLKKLGNSVLSATKALSETSTTTDTNSSTVSNSLTSNADSTKTLSWDSIPSYEAKKVYLTDDNGVRLKNEDGTDQYKILLVDQFGNIRSQEVVDAQHARIKKTINAIWTKIGVGAAAGALGGIMSGGSVTDAAVGAAGGAAVGAIASLGDMSNLKKMRKELKQQDKMLEEYKDNITDEGDLKDASVDPSKLKDLGLKEDNSLTMTASKVKEEFDSSSFKNADNSILDDLDNIGAEITNPKQG